MKLICVNKHISVHITQVHTFEGPHKMLFSSAGTKMLITGRIEIGIKHANLSKITFSDAGTCIRCSL